MSDIDKLFEYIKNDKWKDLEVAIENDTNNFLDLNMRDDQNNYLLTYAVLYNKVNIAKLLIDKGVKIDIVDTDDRCILFLTIKYGYMEMLEYLLKVNKKYISVSIIDVRDKNQNISLHYAIIYKNIKAVELLLKYGSNPNITDKNGNNALHLGIYSRSVNICTTLLGYNININTRTNIGESVLHIACNLQEISIIKLLLNQPDINVNVQDYEHEFTPLHYSINLNNIIQIKLLLEKGANPIIQDVYGNTPVHYSITENNLQALIILLGTDTPNINIWNIESKIPMHLVFEINPDNITEYIDVLIKDTNLNIQDNEGNTCLHYLVKSGLWYSYSIILSKKKLDILIPNKNNKRPIDYVKEKDSDEFINIVAQSYLYRLRNYNNIKWADEWENICTKELLTNKLSVDEIKILKKMDIATKQDGDICLDVSRKKILEIIKMDTKKCTNKSFPIMNSYMCVKINNEQNIGVCTFTGSTLDILIGLIYLLKKHTISCGTVDSKFQNNNDLCSLYETMGIVMSTRCEFLNFEVVWVNNKLYLHDDFYNNFKKCVNNKNKRFIIIPVGIEMRIGSHANYLIYDKELKELERFEPHGSSPPTGFDYNQSALDNILETKMKEMDVDIKYVSPKDYLPKIGFQILDIYEKKKKRIGDPGGFCALWSIWYIDMRLTYKDITRDKLVKILIKEIKKQNISFKNMIRNYGIQIINTRDKIMSKANTDINDWLNDQITDEQIDIIMKEISSEILQIK